MSTRGFYHDPGQDINQLKVILTDQYKLDQKWKGFSILKELVQNADDASATELHIGWSRGIPEADHPLLTEPALFVINNGEFKKQDTKSIRTMSLGHKVGQEESIGKFGLGLKSLFHLGEMFFYLASDGPTAEPKEEFARNNLLNPWSGIYDDLNWDEFSPKSQVAIKRQVASILDKMPQWFCLWVPFRHKNHMSDPLIGSFYPDNWKYVFFPDVDRHLANLFPMLKNLTRIKGWFPDENNQSLREIFTIELDNFGYRLNHDKITRGQEAPLAGQVNIERSSNATNPSVHIFGGKHKLLDDKTLWQLKEEENWPKSSGFDSISDKTLHNLQDKAKPHCAVCFAQFPASSRGNGNLDISWSVFLPLSKMQETQSCRGDTDYLLILHGYFFVDAGRALFEGDGSIGIDKSSDESSVRLKWNGRLRAIGTLPLVLPALEQFVESANLSIQKVYALTEALMKSDLFKDHWEICSQHQWIYRIHETGVGWELVGAENEVYTVPLLASNAATDFPGQVFPSFANLSAQYCITINSYPFLGRKSPSNHWPTELLSQLLSDINIVEIFENRDRLEYFVRFLEQSRQVILLTPQLQQILRYLARQVFTQIELKQLRGFRELVQRFLNLILPEQRFVFTQTTASVWDTALLELLRLDLEVLIVPAGLDSKEGNRLTNPEDVSKILCRLADLLVDQSNKHFIDVCADIARLVLEATDEAERLPILQQCSDLKLFKAQDYQAKGENTLLCWRNFEELKNSRTVFSGAAGKPETLQKALKNEHVVLIDYKLAEVLFGKLQIPQYNPGSCLQTLLRRPLLAEPEARLELLSFIDNQISTPGYADAVRYLLHAQSEDNFASLLVNGSARRPVWTKIIEQIVPKWRVIPEQMANKLARDPHWRILNISEIDVTNVIRHIQEVGPRQIDCSTFNDDDRDTLLREIQDSNDILKGLHIHRSIDDNFVAVVDGKTFLDSDLRSCLDNSLLTQLVLIQPIRQDPQTLLATKQRQLIPPLDAKTIIELVFKQSRPENHWRVIMAVLLSDVRKDQTLDKDLRNKLRKAKWLPTDNHFVAPEDVLYIPGLEDEITRLVSALPGVFVEIQMLHKDISENKDAKKLLARSYFPSQSEALAMLGQMMANDPKYHVGILETSDLTGEKLQNFVEVFDPTVMPACQVLKTILDKVPLDDCLGLFRELIREISVDRIIAVLNYLAEQHQNTPQHKNKFMAIHTWYLASVSQSSDLHNSVLPKIKLLNQRAEWKSTEQLCFEKYGQGIDAGDILDKKQEKIIRKAYPNKLDEEVEVIEVQGSLPPQISGGNLDKHLNASVDLLKEYFKGWGGLVADQLIGSFLCLLGEHQSLHQLAETYLYPRTVAGTREILDWEPNTGAVLAGQSQNIREVMEQTRYIVTVEDAGLTLKVQSITGSYFEARRKPESEFQHLFAGAIVSFSEKSLAGLPLACKVRQLRLIRIHSDARRSELLQNSAREIFKICLRDALPDQSRIVDQSPERVLRPYFCASRGGFYSITQIDRVSNH